MTRGAVKPPEPVLTAHLFPELLTRLLEVLGPLPVHEWDAPVPRKSWTVHEVALHLLGGDVGILSRGRDSFMRSRIDAATGVELVAALAARNNLWIAAGRRMSPQLLCDLLRLTGSQTTTYFQSLDPDAPGEVVSWAGPAPAPNWLDIGREYTERWHHQQHIRAALHRQGLTDPRYLKPALDIFMRALRMAYRRVDAPDGASVTVTITGDSGSRWTLRREDRIWSLYIGTAVRPAASVTIPEHSAWKLFTRWMPAEEARASSRIDGDPRLAAPVFDTTAVIA
ncbi:MAG TPA: maleylpyruvate isomerase N-terminal domain-containing protein [bacterium]|nr:maleylpyruvate isomerase N-terminal domain-containing protein [bacterium]